MMTLYFIHFQGIIPLTPSFEDALKERGTSSVKVLTEFPFPLYIINTDFFGRVDGSFKPSLRASFERDGGLEGVDYKFVDLQGIPEWVWGEKELAEVADFKEKVAQLPEQDWDYWGYTKEARLSYLETVLQAYVYVTLAKHYDVGFKEFSITGENDSGKIRTDSWTSIYLYEAGSKKGTRLDWEIGFRRMTCIEQEFWEKYLAHLPESETQLLKRLVKWK